MIHDACGPLNDGNLMMDDRVDHHEHSNHSKETEIYERLMKDAQELLYPRCDEFSKLSFILKLFQI